jgi:hypothetical protein
MAERYTYDIRSYGWLALMIMYLHTPLYYKYANSKVTVLLWLLYVSAHVRTTMYTYSSYYILLYDHSKNSFMNSSCRIIHSMILSKNDTKKKERHNNGRINLCISVAHVACSNTAIYTSYTQHRLWGNIKQYSYELVGLAGMY